MTLSGLQPTRTQAKGWARVGPGGAHTLRRGAWYPVVHVSAGNIVVLDVNRRNVPVDRRLLEFRYHPPERWSIVRARQQDMDRLGRAFPLTYAVCPTCRHRQAFVARVDQMKCDKCTRASPLAWDELS